VTVAVGARVGPELVLGESAVMRVYLATLVAGEPVATEHDALRWLTADELGDVPWIPADAPVLADLAAQLRGMSRASASGGAGIREPG
jgi:8-oxo-dGTP diphosphatase